jgi:rhodanese-related sulfurtransferase
MNITIDELVLWRRAGFAFRLLDVRRAQARAADGRDIEGATWLDPAHWLDWKDSVSSIVPQGTPVVVYCAHGHEISQGLSAALRAMELDARHLIGGISAWKAAGHATVPVRGGGPALALLYPGDRAMRERADPSESRFAALFAACADAGIRAEPAVYHDDFAGEVAAQLRRVDAVLVWCNPIEGGRRRDRLDALLREVADAGVFVSAHPDTIERLGTKDVLLDTRELPFGSDVQRIDSVQQLRTGLPPRLRRGARVLKQHRGHSGIGVWRVELAGASGDRVRLRHAQRGSAEEVVSFDTLAQTMAPYFEADAGGHMIDQAWQPRLVDGMVRAYLVADRVVGFGHQAVNALYPASGDEPAPAAGPRLYHGADEARFQKLKARLESGWIEQLRACAGVPADRLPLLWDMDFMFGTPEADGTPRHVLCEINVSSVSPFPPSAVQPLVQAVKKRLTR